MDYKADFKADTEQVEYVSAPKTTSGEAGEIEGGALTVEVIAGDVDAVVDGLKVTITAKTTAGPYSVDISGDADLGPGVFTLKDNVSGNIAAPQAVSLGGGVSVTSRPVATPQ